MSSQLARKRVRRKDLGYGFTPELINSAAKVPEYVERAISLNFLVDVCDRDAPAMETDLCWTAEPEKEDEIVDYPVTP